MIRRYNQALMLAGCGVLALCLLVGGCVPVREREPHWNGIRTWEQGSVLKRITSFWQISYTPEPGTVVITIRMPDGKFIPANDLNRGTLAPYFAAGTAYEHPNIAGIIYIRYSRFPVAPPVTVYLDEHGSPKCVAVAVDRWSTQGEVYEPRPAISTPDGTTVLEFPLQEKGLEDLLGKPTKDKKRIMVVPID